MDRAVVLHTPWTAASAPYNRCEARGARSSGVDQAAGGSVARRTWQPQSAQATFACCCCSAEAGGGDRCVGWWARPAPLAPHKMVSRRLSHPGQAAPPPPSHSACALCVDVAPLAAARSLPRNPHAIPLATRVFHLPASQQHNRKPTQRSTHARSMHASHPPPSAATTRCHARCRVPPACGHAHHAPAARRRQQRHVPAHTLPATPCTPQPSALYHVMTTWAGCASAHSTHRPHESRHAHVDSC